ncbi:hypothetical protein V2665_05860 [Tenacibaculum maritimum]|uniref:hypothetical protein n=3 Tax=Tenacibaculum maritimum TaxID=107401 RepID=UPI0012E6EFDC|nr:hypothetical protein [Tenacibaculum maritimum]CAA0209644.1 conserved exported hypothetical protein [Tenacibaculum maritimum]
MKLVRQKMRTISVVLSVMILLSSCTQPNDILEVDSETNVNIDYDGKTLFKSFFFGEQDLNLNINHMNNIKEFRKSLSNKEIIQLSKFSELIVSNIEKKDNNFFKEFKENLTSKNHYKIEESLTESGELIEKSMLEIPEIKEAYVLTSEITKKIDISKFIDENGKIDEIAFTKAIELEYGDDIEAIITPTVLGIWLAAALVQTVVVAVNYYLGVFVAKYTPWDKTAGKSTKLSNLQNQILVNDIYENL